MNFTSPCPILDQTAEFEALRELENLEALLIGGGEPAVYGD